jgi:hypothetical protein
MRTGIAFSHWQRINSLAWQQGCLHYKNENFALFYAQAALQAKASCIASLR